MMRIREVLTDLRAPEPVLIYPSKTGHDAQQVRALAGQVWRAQRPDDQLAPAALPSSRRCKGPWKRGPKQNITTSLNLSGAPGGAGLGQAERRPKSCEAALATGSCPLWSAYRIIDRGRSGRESARALLRDGGHPLDPLGTLRRSPNTGLRLFVEEVGGTSKALIPASQSHLTLQQEPH